MWKNIVKRGRSQITTWRMRIACWIPKDNKYTQSGCVILVAFPLQQWSQERASMLRHTYIARLVATFYDLLKVETCCNKLYILRFVDK